MLICKKCRNKRCTTPEAPELCTCDSCGKDKGRKFFDRYVFNNALLPNRKKNASCPERERRIKDRATMLQGKLQGSKCMCKFKQLCHSDECPLTRA
eukprot:4075441-Karenia_brevis.AAC.1